MSIKSIINKLSVLSVVVLSVVVLSNAATANAYINHYVERGESLWGISHKYNVTIDQLVAANPSLSNGLKAETTIRIPEADDLKEIDNIVPVAPKADNNTSIDAEPFYTAVYGDSFKSISNKTGIPVDTLRKLNPFIDGGTVLEGTVVRLSSKPAKVAPVTVVTTVDSIIYSVQPAVTNKTIYKSIENTVVVMLPFDLNAAEVNRQGLLSTEFYKGLLLSAQSNNNLAGLPPVRIVAIDTKDGVDKSISRLKDLNLGSNSLIIPADDESLIAAVCKYGADNGIMVLNLLSIRDNSYINNPFVLQCSINQPLMYAKAIQYLTQDLDGFTPVILNPANAKSEKNGFVEALRKAYNVKGVDVVDLSFSGNLTDAELGKLKSDKKYVFIPKSGDPDVFGKFAKGLEKYITSRGLDNVKLFGYPDWITFTNENLQSLHDLGATIYSRFYMDDQDITTQEVLNNFKKWYGTPMVKAFPSQGMLGYDAGNLIFRMMRKSWTDDELSRFEGSSYSGEQSAYHFTHYNNSKGLINDALFIVEYLPGESFYVKVL